MMPGLQCVGDLSKLLATARATALEMQSLAMHAPKKFSVNKLHEQIRFTRCNLAINPSKSSFS
jgi:hypothetical protein